MDQSPRDLIAFRTEDEMLEPIESQEYPITELNNNLESDFLIKQEPSEFQECNENQITVHDYNFECDFSMKQEPSEQDNMEIKEEINDDFDYHDIYGNKDSSPLPEYDEENEETSELMENIENQETSELIEYVENQETSELIEYDKNQETELNGEDPSSDDSRPMDPMDGTNEDQPIATSCANNNNDNSNDNNDNSKNNSSARTKIPLWQFFHELLDNPELYGKCTRWVDRSLGVFKIEDTVKVAGLWGLLRKCPMDYDKLSSFMDRYYKKKIIKIDPSGEFGPDVFQFSSCYLE
ncbi:ETS homologous factor-like isoform X2 [Trichogramma pretiosum]|uniref:ETS homologous factor-like isoform X2 n=2 Tax=Trichogramma pretiosum TaxID=7493 RepID=UPI0006C9C420|nr:ETS homologous factor-like isoform X2 [Trichogramma pretiosum]